MESIRNERPDEPRSNINKRLDDIESLIKYGSSKQEDTKDKTQWKPPMKWKSAANKVHKKANEDKILCFYYNVKKQLKGPMFLPLLAGNIIIYKNKAHEFIASEMSTLEVGMKSVPIYIIREIDRKPISNKDWNKVKLRGDSTRDDEVLLKMLKLATIEKSKKPVGKAIWWILGIGIAAVIVLYLIFGK